MPQALVGIPSFYKFEHENHLPSIKQCVALYYTEKKILPTGPPFRGGRGGPPPPMFGRGGPPRNPPPGGFNPPPNFNNPNWGGPMGPPGTMGGGPPGSMGGGPPGTMAGGPPGTMSGGPPGAMGGGPPGTMGGGPPSLMGPGPGGPPFAPPGLINGPPNINNSTNMVNGPPANATPFSAANMNTQHAPPNVVSLGLFFVLKVMGTFNITQQNQGCV